MPEMPGGLAQPVYEVKGTRLSPSSGAYEAPVTGTHWASDGFERRVRARCAPLQVLLTCHRRGRVSECAKETTGDELQRKERMGVVTAEAATALPFSRVAAYQPACHMFPRPITHSC